jgi:pimeloyl-ACP methyl ester carboxylesterase
MRARIVTLLLLAAVALAVSGCASKILAQKIVEAPNRTFPPWPPKGSPEAEKVAQTFSRIWRVPVGPPHAELAVAVVEPGDYGLRFGTAFRRDRHPRVNVDWSPKPNPEISIECKGTIVLLHGFLTSKEMMLHWAVFFAQQGYRAVLVDLRGHGASSGEWITYGTVEAADLVQVMDDLDRRGLAPGGVRVLGVSYGAVMGMHWAARDPRVKTVVALQPFSEPRRAVVEFARGFPDARKLTARLSDATFAVALERAAELADVRWDELNVVEAVKRLRIPVRLYHGGRDTWIPPGHSEALAAAAPVGSELVVFPEDDHLTLSMRLDPLALDVIGWFERPVLPAAVAAGTAAAAPATAAAP